MVYSHTKKNCYQFTHLGTKMVMYQKMLQTMSYPTKKIFWIRHWLGPCDLVVMTHEF